MSARRHVLAIDLGTSGPKVALLEERGAVVASAYEPTRLVLTGDGGVEQDPHDWWRAITVATHRVFDIVKGEVPRDTVAGVCCTAQWLGTVPIGADDGAIGNAIIWMDSRGARYVRELTGGRVNLQGYDPVKLRRWIRLTGGVPAHSGKDPTAHILFLRHERPEVYRAARLFLEPKDYLNLRLTGRAVATFDSIAGTWVADTRDLTRVTYDDTLLRMAQIDRATMPPLVRAVDVVGPVTPSVADELGIPATAQVVGGTPDVQSATLGSGAVGDFAAHLYLGTSSWITCHVPFKKTDVLHNIASMPAALPDRYIAANSQETAGACLTWLRDNILWPQDALAPEPAPADALARIDALAETAPPGSNGVLFTPWLNGERTPVDDPSVRASWVHQSLATTRADLVRAVLEGVAYNSAWLLHTVERFTGRRLDPLRAIGGGASSDVWCRIHADVLGRTVEPVEDPRSANVRGAGFLGLVGLGLARIDDLARSVRVTARYEPDRANTEMYRALAREYRELYKRTKGIHARIGRVPAPRGARAVHEPGR